MLHLKCKGQEMKVDVDERIADKYINANKVHFEFCERWAGMIITAQFTQKQDGVDKTYDVVVDELTNMVTMPNEIVAGEVHISAFGVDPVTGVRITSIPVKKTIDKSGFVGDGETPVPPTPDLYAQLLEQFGNGVPPSTGANKQLVTDKSGAIVWDNLRVMAGTKNGAVRTSAAAAEQVLGYKLGEFAFAANLETEASGYAAFAAGNGTEAIGKNSFAEGNGTIANGENQHVQGKYNVKDTANKYAHIVGNGTTSAKRANAHTLDWDGNAWFKGDVYVGGDDQSKGEKLVTKSELDAAVAAGGGGSGEGGGGGLPTGGEPHQMLVTDGEGNAKWEARIPTTGGVDIIPETVLTTDSSEFYYTEPLGGEVVVGNTYTVKWNGVGYNCEAAPFEMEGITWTVLGNIGAMMGGTPSEEPFVIIIVPPYVASEMGAYAMLMSMEGLTEVTVCIPGGVKIDNSALDVDWVAKYDNVGETIVAETVGKGINTEVAATDTSFFVEGAAFIAYVDNVRYDLAVLNHEGELVAGNLGLAVPGAPGNGEPFYITAGDGKLTFFRAWTDDNDALHTIAVYLPGNLQRIPNQKLPEDFLPDTGVYYVDLADGEVNRNFDEIQAAYELGKTVCCREFDSGITQSDLYYLTRLKVYGQEAHFAGFINGKVTEIKIENYNQEAGKYNYVTMTTFDLAALT